MDRLQVCILGNLKAALRQSHWTIYISPLLIADGADYTGGLLTATFSSNTISVRVPILSDNVLEGLETFTGVIQVPPETTTNYRVTAGSPDTVNIIDATSEFTIHVQRGQVTLRASSVAPKFIYC